MTMKVKEIRELSRDELLQRIAEEQQDLRHLRFQHAVADVQNPINLRKKRRLVAQLKTILREKS
jgi:large subunit ribosomal protein L29